MGHISSDILRANNYCDNEVLIKCCIKTALSFMVLTMNDDKWKNDLQFLASLHNELTKMYLGESKDFLQLYQKLCL